MPCSSLDRTSSPDRTRPWVWRACVAAACLAPAAVLPASASAKDLGQHGALFPIAERSLLELITETTERYVASGAWDAANKAARERARARIERPAPVEGLRPATEPRQFTYDPTIVAPQDYEDGFGNVVVARGTTANPLDVVALPAELVFFDADRPEQRRYALERYAATDGDARLILVNGSPLEMMREHRLRVYFDQKGLLSRQFGLTRTPSRIHQTGRVLTIEEVALPPDRRAAASRASAATPIVHAAGQHR